MVVNIDRFRADLSQSDVAPAKQEVFRKNIAQMPEPIWV
jgi:hypothetical protein